MTGTAMHASFVPLPDPVAHDPRLVRQGGEGQIRLMLQLDPAQYAQVHCSSIVNRHAVERIDKDGTAMAIRLKGERGTLAVSEAYACQFRKM